MPVYPSFNRRRFLQVLTGAALARPASARVYNPRLVAHTSVWLAEAAVRNKRPADILEEALRVTRRAGYRRVALAAGFTAPDLRDRTLTLLDRFDLEPSIVAVAGPMHTAESAEGSRREALTLARGFSGRAAFIAFSLSPAPGGRRKTDAELDTEAYQLHLLGLDLQHTGVGLLLDHGAAEMAENAREWRHIAAHTEARLLSLCVDVEAAIRGGANPWVLIDTAGPRLRDVHVRNTRHGADLDALEDGDINLPLIAKLLREAQYDGFLSLELKRAPERDGRRDLAESLASSRWRMQELFATRPGAFPVDMGPHVRIPRPR